VKVILNQEVRGVGSPGDVVEVAGGYGRNYLLPRNLARPATKGAVREAEAIRARRQAREMATLEQAQTMASHLASVRVTIPAKAGPEGRLFGSITAQQVAEAIQEAARTTIDRRRISLESPIKQTGVHRLSIRLHPEVEANVDVEIVPA
jgi:large subunit ribosomal protein L9